MFFYALQNDLGTREGFGPVATTVEGILAMWANFVAPIVAAVTCSLVAGIEHANRGWKELLATSLPRSAVFVSKFFLTSVLWVVAHVALACSIALTIGGLKLARGDAFRGPLEPRILFGFVALVCTAGLLLLTVHMVLALRWPSFALNVGVSLGGLLLGLVLVESTARNFYPWSAPAAVQSMALPLLFGLEGRAGPGHVAAVLGANVLAAGVVLLGSTMWLSSRDVS
jgi:hypothetical protein